MSYSTASVTDFDSNDDHSSGNISVNSSYSNNSSSTISAFTSQSCRVYEFGEFEDNYGWIQCQSKSYPNRVYYHNTRSGCSTWYRPISRFIDIPFVSIRRANCTDDDALESTNDLELMSVSDDERDSRNVSGRVTARDRNGSLTEVSDIIARYYYTPQIDLSANTDDSWSSTNEYTSELYRTRERADVIDENNNTDDSNAVRSPLCATNFLETEFFVRKGDVNTEGTSRIFDSLLKENTSDKSPFQTKRIVYGVPRLKRIGIENQLIKPKRTRVCKSRKAPGPRKIISDMYGVRTISYDLPEPDQACEVAGVKTTTLSASDSDSDTNVPSSSSRCAKFESECRDITRNLRQPLLSDSNSSPSSRSDTTSSSSSSSSSSCSCSSCNREV